MTPVMMGSNFAMRWPAGSRSPMAMTGQRDPGPSWPVITPGPEAVIRETAGRRPVVGRAHGV